MRIKHMVKSPAPYPQEDPASPTHLPTHLHFPYTHTQKKKKKKPTKNCKKRITNAVVKNTDTQSLLRTKKDWSLVVHAFDNCKMMDYIRQKNIMGHIRKAQHS